VSRIGPDVMCFDVERGLAKALAIKCETFVCGPDLYKIRIGQRWNLVVNEEQLGDLWNDVDNPSALRNTFDTIKSTCLVFQTFQR
jgi:hypothetical protein